MTNKIFYGIGSALFAGAAFAFLAYTYPHHLHNHEQLQLFLYTGDYAREVMSMPGGVANYIGRYLTQFFINNMLGAAIIAGLLLLTQLITWGLLVRKPEWAYPLSFLPSVALWMHCCDDNGMLAAVVALSITLGAAFLLCLVKNQKSRLIACLVLTPCAMFGFGPLGIGLPIVVLMKINWEKHKQSLAWCLAMAFAAAVTIAAERFFYPYQYIRILGGIGYYRFPYVIAAWPWVALIVAVCLTGTSRFFRETIADAKLRMAVCAVSILAVGYVAEAGVQRTADMQKEELLGYDYMARMHQWNKIIQTANTKQPDAPMSVATLNLALAKTGQLGENMFHYYQNGQQGLLPEFVRDFITPLPTSEAYYQLGMINTAQRFAFEAQEAQPDFQKSVRCYKRMAETNIINGNYVVARKYLKTLSSTLAYSNWAKNQEKLLGDEEAINKHPEYGYMRQVKHQQDFMFSDIDMDSMLGLLYQGNPENKLAYDYLMAWCLLQKDLKRFMQCYAIGAQYLYNHVPTSYQEAIALSWTRQGNKVDEMPSIVSPQVKQRMTQFVADVHAKLPTQQMKDRYGSSYWYYYFYNS